MNTATIHVLSDLEPGAVDIALPVLDVLEIAKLGVELERRIIARLTMKKEN